MYLPMSCGRFFCDLAFKGGGLGGPAGVACAIVGALFYGVAWVSSNSGPGFGVDRVDMLIIMLVLVMTLGICWLANLPKGGRRRRRR